MCLEKSSSKNPLHGCEGANSAAAKGALKPMFFCKTRPWSRYSKRNKKKPSGTLHVHCKRTVSFTTCYMARWLNEI